MPWDILIILLIAKYANDSFQPLRNIYANQDYTLPPEDNSLKKVCII